MDSYRITPIYWGDPALTESVHDSAFTTFTCEDPSGQYISEIDVPQIALFSETITLVPPILYQPHGQKDTYDFRLLIGVNARKDVSCAWVAFELMVKWLNTGVYQNDEMEATHIDAYLLAEKLQSPRFGNAVMKQILAQIQGTKNDGSLADNMRRLCEEGSEESLLKKLYFDTALYWFPPSGYLNGTRNPKYFEGAGVLMTSDAYWLNTLERHKRETCVCSPAKRRKVHIRWDDEKGQEGAEGCQVAPWLDKPERYFCG